MKRLSIAFRLTGLLLIFSPFLDLIFWRSLFSFSLFGLLIGCGFIVSIFFASDKIAKFALSLVASILIIVSLLIIAYFGVIGGSFCYLFLGLGLICSTFFLNAHNEIPEVVSSKKEYYQRVVSESELENLLPQGWNVVAVLPSGKVVINNEHIKQAKINTVSDAWYLLPLFFSILGGIIGYVGVNNRNSGKARNILACGAIVFVLEVVFLLFL